MPDPTTGWQQVKIPVQSVAFSTRQVGKVAAGGKQHCCASVGLHQPVYCHIQSSRKVGIGNGRGQREG